MGLTLMVINRLSGLVVPSTTKWLMDDVIGGQQWDLLPRLAMIAGAATLVASATSFWLSQVLGIAAQRAITDMRKQLQAHVLRLPIRHFDSTKTGTLISRIMSDADAVRHLVGTGLVQLTGSILTALVSLGVLFYLNWRLTAATVLLLVAFGIGIAVAFTRLRPLFRERGQINAEVTGRLAVHFVKEGAVISKASRSSEKFMHGIKVLMAKNYVDNLSEEVKKGLREKAEQGHWPTVAPVGYVNNRETHRIESDPVRGPLVAKVFELYASGDYSLSALRRKAQEIGLTHWRRDRPLSKSEVHRMLLNLIYTGEFVWLGKVYQGSHAPLITRDTFERAQAVLQHKPRGRYRKQRHPFMGLSIAPAADVR
jgi:ABC-type multidrug transport system fused ATPase/permease subunit